MIKWLNTNLVIIWFALIGYGLYRVWQNHIYAPTWWGIAVISIGAWLAFYYFVWRQNV